MTVSPQLRRALHTALDVVLDALAEEPTKVKRTRTIKPPPLPDISDIPEHVIEEVTKRLEKQGYRRKAP